MSDSKNCAVVLAGGQGKRMKSPMPKPMLEVLGEPMLDWVISACVEAGAEPAVITGFGREYIENHLGGRYPTFFQSERLGTGHAVMQAIPLLEEKRGGNTLILCGDAPFVSADIIKNSLCAHLDSGAAVTVVSAELSNPFGYGRIIRDGKGEVLCITEQKDCTPEEAAIKEVNSGIYWFRTAELLTALSELTPNNAQGEYYLTDTLSILLSHGEKIAAYKTDDRKAVLGANDRRGLLMLNTEARMAVIDKHLDNGVEFICTDGIIIERSVKIGAGTKILPGTVLKKNTVIGEGCIIGPNTTLENVTVGDGTVLNNVQAVESEIGSNAHIGPYVNIRPNCVIHDGAKIGDFVELKNSVIGEKSSMAHLSYVGDTDMGAQVNMGGGCITCNYDGVNKFRTVIEDRAFIGCNTNLVAPVRVGFEAYTAAGSTVTKDVPDNALAVERAPLKIRENYTQGKFKDKKWK